MLLDRLRPLECQRFGDYIIDIGKRNGFKNNVRFKKYLIESSQARYDIEYSQSNIMRVITGIFIELAIDRTKESDNGRRLCFSCLKIKPIEWDWSVLPENYCKEYICREYFEEASIRSGRGRKDFCGIMRTNIKDLGLDYSTRKAALYFSDILS
ncbi:MAG: hypothetical protein Q7W55_13625 [Pseudohongiella sp.]|nr:hypothetical protein [Pseudohongiella sp.]